jgi:hypothetical protein
VTKAEMEGFTVEDRLETERDELRTCKAEGHGEGRVAGEMEERGAGKERGGVPTKERVNAASYVPIPS